MNSESNYGTFPFFPFNISLEVTTICPNKCSYCYALVPYRKHREISWEVLRKSMEEIVKLKPFMFFIGGGEPTTLSLQKLEYILRTGENIPSITLSTNGYLLNDKFLDIWLKYRDGGIQVTLLGNERVHDIITGRKGSYKDVINAIRLLEEYNVGRSIGFVLMKYNIKQIDHILEIARRFECHVHVMIIMPNMIMSWEEYQNKYLPAKKDLINVVNKLRKKREEFLSIGLNIDYGNWLYNEKMFSFPKRRDIDDIITGCSAGVFEMVIDIDGNVYPCEILRNKEFIIGNLLKENLHTIWFEKMDSFRKTKLSIPKECRACSVEEYCKGGCIALRYIKYRNDFIKYGDPLCKFMKR